jgi:hypothetical protein
MHRAGWRGLFWVTTMKLDHIAISGQTLEEAADWTEACLGVPLQAGGAHDVYGTHNQLLGFKGGHYLEVISVDPSTPTLPFARWFDLDRFSGPPRLTNWICQVSDLDQVLSHLPQAGKPVQLSRGDLRWRMAVPDSGILPYDNCFPALIEWQSPVHPSALLTGQGCQLQRLTITHPDADALKAELSPFLEPGVITFQTGDRTLKADIDTPNGLKHL